MGSAQSRAQRRDQETSPEDSRVGIRRRFEPLRRLSTLGSLGGRRRGKRDRAQSTSPPEDGGKRQRLSEEDDEGEDNIEVTAPDWDFEEEEGSRTVEIEMETTRARPSIPTPTPTPSPQSHSLPLVSPPIHTQTRPDLRSIFDQAPPPPLQYPVRRPDEVVNEPLHLPERRRLIRTPIWHSAVTIRRRRSRSAIVKSAPTTDTAPLRRTRSEPAIGNPLIPLPPSDTLEARSHRLRIEGEYLEGTRALLQEHLDNARRDMAAAEVEATAARERLRRLDDEAARMPGAVMMIQGIAQTHVPAPAERRRRFGRRPRGTAEGEREIPFEEQADTIIGLILVASLATANTLLSSQRPRPAPNDMIQNLMRRIQPGRAFAVDNMLANSNQTPNADPSISPPDPLTQRSPSPVRTSQSLPSTEPETNTTGESYNAPPEFYAWLHGLQDNIRGSIREFMGNTSLALSRTTSTLEPSAARPDPMRRISAPNPTYPVLSVPTTSQDTQPEGSVPQFHTQPGQNNAPDTDAGNPAVTTDENGNRRLNFFRAYIFPSTDGEDSTANVPCLFVGVRSTSQDAGTLGEDLANNPSYAFGNDRPATTTNENAMSVEEQVVEPTPTPGRPTPSRTQTLRSRLLALSPFSPQAPEESAPSPVPEPTPTATYIMYVIGGNYPRNHPVLTIPGLLTGEPLSDEEMARIGELLGEVKPPTATAEEVEKSGLRVIDASEIQGLVERKEVVDSSAERCLVCLSDFEAGEECRLLSCRHVFHRECVDQWIKVGRNACPACRTEAVDRTKSKTEQETSNTTNTNPSADVTPSDISASDHAPAV